MSTLARPHALALLLALGAPVSGMAQPSAELRLERLPEIVVPDAVPTPLMAEEIAAAAHLDRETTDRLRFIEARLRKARRPMSTWYGIWTAGYAAGAVIQTARLGFETRPAWRGELLVSASKAIIGTVARAARPPRAMRGDHEIVYLPEMTPEDRRIKLMAAERILARNAKESDQRYSWLAHSLNIGLNVVGGVIVGTVWKDWAVAGQSIGTGLAVGELSIWTMPWWTAKRDLREYRHRYGETISAPRAASAHFSGPRWSTPTLTLIGPPVERLPVAF